MDGGAWQAVVHGVIGSQTRLSDFIFTFNFSCIGEGNDNPLQCSWLENPRDGEPGGLPSLRSHKSRTQLKKPSSSSIDYGASLLAQLVKNPPAMWETWVQSWVGKIPWRRERLPTPVFWPGEFHGLYSPWGCKYFDTIE